MERTKKKQNAFVSYFTPFGLKQVCDILMIIGLVLLIVGLCTNDGVLLAGFITYAVASLGAVVLSVLHIIKIENPRDPARKEAIVNVIIMGVLFALALFGIIWVFVD